MEPGVTEAGPGCHGSESPRDGDHFLLIRRVQVGRLPRQGVNIGCLVYHPPGQLCGWDYPFRPVASFYASLDDALCAIKGAPPPSVIGLWRMDGARVGLRHEDRTVESTRVESHVEHEWSVIHEVVR